MSVRWQSHPDADAKAVVTTALRCALEGGARQVSMLVPGRAEIVMQRPQGQRSARSGLHHNLMPPGSPAAARFVADLYGSFSVKWFFWFAAGSLFFNRAAGVKKVFPLRFQENSASTLEAWLLAKCFLQADRDRPDEETAVRRGIEQKRSLAEFFDWYNPASLHPSLYPIEEKRFC